MSYLIACLLLVTSTLSEGALWRVNNGKEALKGQFPFVASIMGCTASILNENTILTAGHCVCKQDPIFVIMGIVSKRYDPNPKQKGVPVDKVIIHPSYISNCGKVHPSDIAIIKLKKKIKFDKNVQPIEIACQEVSNGESIINIGFGRDGSKRSGILKYGFNIANYNCAKGYICSDPNPNSINLGDSGGPMVIKSGSVFLQAGVTSGIGSYSYYANVPAACKWIKNQM